MKTHSSNPVFQSEEGTELSDSFQSADRSSPRSVQSPKGGSGIRKRRRLVGVVLDPESPEIHAGILRAARELRWDVFESTAPDSRSFDGVLSTTAPDVLWKWTRDLQCPVVRIVGSVVSSSSAMPLDGIPTVALDLAEAGTMAAKHLLSLGTSNLIFFRNYGASGPGALCQSFQETCRLAGTEALVLDTVSGRPEDRAAWLLRQVSALPLPCAIMADHDRFAVELIAAAGELGLRVPEDLAVLGTENLPEIQKRSKIPVTSLDMNLELLGYTAAHLLDRSMKGETIEPVHHFISPKRVIERQSTATYSCDIPGISKAILKIRSHYAKPISVPAMARECGLSVRSLYRLYRATTGNTIGKDIMAKRIAAAAEMLSDENLKLEPIAMETGLGNAKNLCRLFKEYYGKTPGQWRASGKEISARKSLVGAGGGA